MRRSLMGAIALGMLAASPGALQFEPRRSGAGTRQYTTAELDALHQPKAITNNDLDRINAAAEKRERRAEKLRRQEKKNAKH